MDSTVLRSVAFVMVTIFFTVISRRSLCNPRSHGFYRYFAFVGIACLLLYNQPVWFDQPFSGLHCLSWLLLAVSIVLVVHGLGLLRRMGGQGQRQSAPENLAFENTQHLVVDGLYRYIRHPMYTSLLLLAWGAFLKRIDLLTLTAVGLVSVALLFTAKVEEAENVTFWGADYLEYKSRSKMFIPFIF
ncbi:Protein-S-isoprenylcysteine O-methyltransferase Ste14 [Desulfuromusa kysingii]|uniref:Protein-S-isoprenylcysteine O-methyltransferase Ste14 n=1 Tax=Desulfuromusa kysingii TaxID=37625 RepID=A0A1H4CHF6_9BACT|nr:isoprenylcysteine carboxylmethyltransferase family protein [Desulfuromusa kysingii]SEA59784.1 Protein-S-isoprenylcysteine O-methyltransferase Ste14 [Desulfuromusa kysingii]